MTDKAVFLFSGGLDSVAMASKIVKTHDVYALTFDYGQKAKKELESAKYFAKKLEFNEHKIIDVSFLKTLYGDSTALIDDDKSLPSTFDQTVVVPVRNAIFLSIATAYALSIGAKAVFCGIYGIGSECPPDSRLEFTHNMEQTLYLADRDAIDSGLRSRVQIVTPATSNLSKIEILKGGVKELGDDIVKAWSCYANGDIHCGTCTSCIERWDAFARANLTDPTEYAEKCYIE